MSERMQWSEAEMVVRAYRAEHGVTDDVDVATLARALGTDVAEVRRLAGRKRRFIDRSGWLSAGVAALVAVVVIAAVGPKVVTKNPLLARLMPISGPVTRFEFFQRHAVSGVSETAMIPDLSAVARTHHFYSPREVTILSARPISPDES